MSEARGAPLTASQRDPQRQRASGYVGRFAPSPSGPLHAGSVVAAIGSWLDARANHGRWLLRIDDLDAPRNVRGAESLILDELQRLGLDWDGPLTRQSADSGAYLGAIEDLRAAGLAFACGCSRRDLVDGIYPGTCRNGLKPGAKARSVRFRVSDTVITIDDAIQGRFRQHLGDEVGDFVLLRADGIIAYHLATVLDDAAAAVTHIVRGADLLPSTPRQIALQQALRLPTPHYAHLPVLTNSEGQKLSKQTHAPASAHRSVEALWCEALHCLGLSDSATMPIEDLRQLGLKELRDWALQHWSLSRVPKEITAPQSGG